MHYGLISISLTETGLKKWQGKKKSQKENMTLVISFIQQILSPFYVLGTWDISEQNKFACLMEFTV